MQTNIKYIIIGVVAVLIISVGSFYIGKKTQTTEENSPTSTSTSDVVVATSTNTTQTTKTGGSSNTTNTTKPSTNLTSGNTAGFYSYTNNEFNFSMKYPNYVKISNVFSTFHEIGNYWRLYASTANRGKNVESFVVFNTDQGAYANTSGKQNYPLYFTAEVRVGVSPNVKDCYALAPSFANEKVTDVTINGVAFKRFSTLENNSPKYTQAESYRTVHNNNCYVIEQIKSGTSYKDDKMAPGISDSTLEGYYNTAGIIAKTFRFTK